MRIESAIDLVQRGEAGHREVGIVVAPLGPSTRYVERMLEFRA